MGKVTLTPLEIAVYAVNCPNDDKSVNEVYNLIDDHVIERLVRVKNRLELSILIINELRKENEALKKEIEWQKQDIEAPEKIESFLTKWPKQCKAKSNADCKFGECDCSEISTFILPT